MLNPSLRALNRDESVSTLPINYVVSWLLWKSSSLKWPQHKSVSISLISAEWSAAVKRRYRTARKPTPPLLLVRNQVCTLSRTDLQLKLADLFRISVQVLHPFTSLQHTIQTMRLHAIPDASMLEPVAHDYDDEVQNVLKASQVRFATIPLASQHEVESSAICNRVSNTKSSQVIHLF